MKQERPGLSLKRAELALISAKERALAPFELTISQYATLHVLEEMPGAPGAEVARQCLVTPQAITGVLNNLEGRGLIERRRHPYHRTLRELHLTDSGRALLVRADKAALAVEALLVDGFTASEVDVLRQLLQRCAENVGPPRR